MSATIAAERFEPVFLDLDRALPSDFTLDRAPRLINLAGRETRRWRRMDHDLRNTPTAITSGISQYGMAGLINYINNNGTAMTRPSTVYMALTTAAPSSTSTGATITEASYTGYARVNITASLGAASAATPSVATNSSTITFGNCTAGTSTLAGFVLVDSSSGAGNVLWYGTLSSVTISTTQTPPTVAASALTLSMTGT